ncbi:spondin domain-containing protein [Hwanghaeella grinnelliae]|nr:spondin domain-containing protein [Hwanghaeella grinnelliae]
MEKLIRFAALAFFSIAPMAVATAQDSADYHVTVTLNWTEAAFPVGFPEDPHFSRFIGMTHNERFTLFADGQTASTGLGLVATNGRVSILKAELGEMTRRKRIGSVVEADALKAGAGVVQMTATLTSAHNRFSFATMVAPSPDWITGASGIVLNPDGPWLESLTLPLWVWDAGVDGGQTFTSPDDPLPVKESVRLAATPYFLHPAGLLPIGTVVFVRVR